MNDSVKFLKIYQTRQEFGQTHQHIDPLLNQMNPKLWSIYNSHKNSLDYVIVFFHYITVTS